MSVTTALGNLADYAIKSLNDVGVVKNFICKPVDALYKWGLYLEIVDVTQPVPGIVSGLNAVRTFADTKDTVQKAVKIYENIEKPMATMFYNGTATTIHTPGDPTEGYDYFAPQANLAERISKIASVTSDWLCTTAGVVDNILRMAERSGCFELPREVKIGTTAVGAGAGLYFAGYSLFTDITGVVTQKVSVDSQKGWVRDMEAIDYVNAAVRMAVSVMFIMMSVLTFVAFAVDIPLQVMSIVMLTLSTGTTIGIIASMALDKAWITPVTNATYIRDHLI